MRSRQRHLNVGGVRPHTTRSHSARLLSHWQSIIHQRHTSRCRPDGRLVQSFASTHRARQLQSIVPKYSCSPWRKSALGDKSSGFNKRHGPCIAGRNRCGGGHRGEQRLGTAPVFNGIWHRNFRLPEKLEMRGSRRFLARLVHECQTQAEGPGSSILENDCRRSCGLVQLFVAAPAIVPSSAIA